MASAPKTAAAPQMELPTEVSKAVSRSILSILPNRMPKKIVPTTITASTVKALHPTSRMLAIVSRKP